MTSTAQPTPTTAGVTEAMVEAFQAKYREIGERCNWSHSWPAAECVREMLEAALSTAPAGDGVPGMVLVPRDAGWEMKVAARDIDWPRPNIYGQFSDSNKEEAAAKIWAVMLTASTAGGGK